MLDSRFDPERFFDREAEQACFQELLALATPARILAIEDEAGTGKSLLLQQLQHFCRVRCRPQIPACLIDFSQLAYASELSLVVQIAEQLSEARGVSLPSLEAYQRARKAELSLADLFRGTIEGQARLDGAEFHETGPVSAIGVQINLAATTLAADYLRPLLEDIRRLAQERPTVILLDAFDQCGPELAHWVRERIFDELCFDLSARPASLIFVVAGHNLAHFRSDLRWAREEREQIVRALRPLSRWRREHVEACLSAFGLADSAQQTDVFYALYERQRMALANFVQAVHLMSLGAAK